MKIAVPVDVDITNVNEKSSILEWNIYSRFGRAPFFCLVNTEEEGFSFVENKQNLNAAQGAGIQSAQNIVNSGAEALVTSHCGPKAFATLQAGDVAVYLSDKKTITEAVADIKSGKIKPADSPDRDGHWV